MRQCDYGVFQGPSTFTEPVQMTKHSFAVCYKPSFVADPDRKWKGYKRTGFILSARQVTDQGKLKLTCVVRWRPGKWEWSLECILRDLTWFKITSSGCCLITDGYLFSIQWNMCFSMRKNGLPVPIFGSPLELKNLCGPGVMVEITPLILFVDLVKLMWFSWHVQR